jgi:hypothetical protein
MKQNMLDQRKDYITKRKNELLREKKSLLKLTTQKVNVGHERKSDNKTDPVIENPDTR